tara:strand:+ start:109 stop:711 length:603 start_codon:yes stop_codon:yes gene_type:complete
MQTIVGKHPCQKVCKSAAMRSIGMIGSRSLPQPLAERVGNIVEDLLSRHYHIASGGAIGADQFVIERLLRIGRSDSCTVYSAWKNYAGFPVKVRAMMRQFKEYGGHLLWGVASGKEAPNLIRMGLLLRNQCLVDACYGLVAFIDGHSRGSLFTIKKAASKRLVIVVFPHECQLPVLSYVKWVPLRCGGCWEGGFKAVYLK